MVPATRKHWATSRVKEMSVVESCIYFLDISIKYQQNYGKKKKQSKRKAMAISTDKIIIINWK